MLHVNRKERGLISPLSLTTLLENKRTIDIEQRSYLFFLEDNEVNVNIFRRH